MKRNLILAAGALGLSVAAFLTFGATDRSPPRPDAPPEGAPIVQVALPATLSPQATMGQRAFNAVCASCHGENGAGRAGMGPPFIHPIYEPDHHGDMAFQVAVAQGVRAHHWPFGNMPPQQGLTRSDVGNIIAYVRELQQANGIR